jgi:sugar phosphate isomerase/epimerase
MTKPIAVQLYSLRDALSADFAGTLRRVADMGAAGVEFAGIYGSSPADAAALCRELGLKICSAHLPLPVGADRNSVLTTATALGIEFMVCPWMPPERFATLEGIEAVCADINLAVDTAEAQGLHVGYHNHDAEFRSLPDDSLVFDHMRRLLRPEVFFEVDIYWVTAAGVDPVAVVTSIKNRLPLLHVKDGSGAPGSAMLAAGEGIVPIPAVVNALGDAGEWLIVELDSCATDMFEAVEKSIGYLVDQGLGHRR